MNSDQTIELFKKLDLVNKKIDSISERVSKIEDFQGNIKNSVSKIEDFQGNIKNSVSKIEGFQGNIKRDISEIEKNTAANTEVAVKMSKYANILDFSERVIPFLEQLKPKFLENFSNTEISGDDSLLDDPNSDFDE